MAKKNGIKRETIKNIKRIGIVLFISGFLFAQPVLAATGAVVWGGLTLYDIAQDSGLKI